MEWLFCGSGMTSCVRREVEEEGLFTWASEVLLTLVIVCAFGGRFLVVGVGCVRD